MITAIFGQFIDRHFGWIWANSAPDHPSGILSCESKISNYHSIYNAVFSGQYPIDRQCYLHSNYQYTMLSSVDSNYQYTMLSSVGSSNPSFRKHSPREIVSHTIHTLRLFVSVIGSKLPMDGMKYKHLFPAFFGLRLVVQQCGLLFLINHS